MPMPLQFIIIDSLVLELAGVFMLSIDALGMKDNMTKDLDFHIQKRDSLYRGILQGLGMGKMALEAFERVEGNRPTGDRVYLLISLVFGMAGLALKLLGRHVWVLYLTFVNKRIGWIGLTFLITGFALQAYVNFKLI